MRLESLRTGAIAVLRGNDCGAWTKAAPQLYPHQWSWDAAFVAIGWAHIDVGRALTELESLFAGQWSTGMVPHIVFDSAPAAYFPGPDRWDSAVSPHAPAAPRTSGICQPPVHAIALRHILEQAQRHPGQPEETMSRVGMLFPRLLRWHRYLLTERDPQRSGLVTIYHPWESGADNSPRWDTALAKITVGDMPPYRRYDTTHVTDLTQRPTNGQYHRYLWLVELAKRCGYDEGFLSRNHPFALKDVFFSAILVSANRALLELADAVNATAAERAEIAGWIRRGEDGVRSRFAPGIGLANDYDVRTGESIELRSFAGFAPLIAGGCSSGIHEAQLTELESDRFIAAPGLRWPLVPTVSPTEPDFDPRSYWRGPVWPVITWLLWRAVRQVGEHDGAEALRRAALAQIETAGFTEYVEPFTGEALGSDRQSWTAAVVLDWLAAER